MKNIARPCRSCIHYISPIINKSTLEGSYGLCKKVPLENPNFILKDNKMFELAIVARTKICKGKYYQCNSNFTKK